MKKIGESKGRLVFGNGLRVSTIESVKSTWDLLDALIPDNITYLIESQGRILYTKLDVVEGKLQLLDGSLIDMDSANLVYILDEDDEDNILPLTVGKSKFTEGYTISNNDPIIIRWVDNKIVCVENIPSSESTEN